MPRSSSLFPHRSRARYPGADHGQVELGHPLEVRLNSDSPAARLPQKLPPGCIARGGIFASASAFLLNICLDQRVLGHTKAQDHFQIRISRKSQQ